MFNDRQLDRIERKLNRLLVAVGVINYKENTIMAELDDITAAVTENTSVVDSAILLLNDLADRLEAAAGDPAALAALTSEIRTNSANLGAAIAANTPA